MAVRNEASVRHPRPLRRRLRLVALVVLGAVRILLDDLVECASYLEHETV